MLHTARAGLGLTTEPRDGGRFGCPRGAQSESSPRPAGVGGRGVRGLNTMPEALRRCRLSIQLSNACAVLLHRNLKGHGDEMAGDLSYPRVRSAGLNFEACGVVSTW